MCVSFFIGFKVSCDTLNTFEKKERFFKVSCGVSLFYRCVVVGKTTVDR